MVDVEAQTPTAAAQPAPTIFKSVNLPLALKVYHIYCFYFSIFNHACINLIAIHSKPFIFSSMLYTL